MDRFYDYIGRETWGGSRVDIYVLQNNTLIVRLMGIVNNPWIDDESCSRNMYIEVKYPIQLSVFDAVNIIYDFIDSQIPEQYNDKGAYIHINKSREYDKGEFIPFTKENLSLIETYKDRNQIDPWWNDESEPEDESSESIALFYSEILENGTMTVLVGIN